MLSRINSKFQYLIWPSILLAAMTLDKHKFGWILSIPLAVLLIFKVSEIFSDTHFIED